MIHLSRSTAVFAVRLLLSVAVVYRFFPAENKSIFAQRYGPCTPPEGTKHTNVRRAGTKYKTFVKDMHDALVSCGFSALAPLAEMRYTGNTKTNVKEITPSVKPCGFASSLGEGGSGMAGRFLIAFDALALRATACALSVIAARCHTPPFVAARHLPPERGKSFLKGRGKSSGGNFRITPNALATGFKSWLPLWGSWQSR